MSASSSSLLPPLRWVYVLQRNTVNRHFEVRVGVSSYVSAGIVGTVLLVDQTPATSRLVYSVASLDTGHLALAVPESQRYAFVGHDGGIDSVRLDPRSHRPIGDVGSVAPVDRTASTSMTLLSAYADSAVFLSADFRFATGDRSQVLALYDASQPPHSRSRRWQAAPNSASCRSSNRNAPSPAVQHHIALSTTLSLYACQRVPNNSRYNFEHCYTTFIANPLLQDE
jgi:hypothetical protein